jgi:hypothetical protein
MSEDTETTPKKPEDVRAFAVDKLAEHLAVGVSLAQLCEDLANKATGDRLGPIYAAARVMRANAAVAEVLATVGGIERRRRSIVERIQPPDPKKAQLNSDLQKRKVLSEDREKIFRRLNEHVEQTIRARMGEVGSEDSIARLIRAEEKERKYVEEQLADLDGDDNQDDDENDD